MKKFEKYVKTLIMIRTDHLIDPLQFLYRPGRGMDGAVATLINYVVRHLEEAKSHARVLSLNSQMTQLYSVSCLTMKLAMVLC